MQSPVRAYRSVGGVPPFLQAGSGARVTDVDGKSYIDYVLSYGPLVVGHANPRVVSAIQQAAENGTSFGAPSEPSLKLGRKIQARMPSLEMMRFVNSGTEATMTALRLARAFTGRSKIIKFEGCYHGHADMLLVQAGSGVATLGLPDSPGVTQATTADTLVAEFNKLQSVERHFESVGSEIAAVIVEPVAGNMGLVLPESGFLEGLRELCNQHQALLIFDEVMTGFRVGPGGAQERFGVRPDLTTLGKVIGGGLPVGAYGGRRDVMEMVAPLGDMYQAGTLSGNPLAMSAGIATLELLAELEPWDQFESLGKELDVGIEQAAKQHGVELCTVRCGSMSAIYFAKEAPKNWNEVKSTNAGNFKAFFHSLLEQGVMLAPSPFEAAFISTEHREAEIGFTIQAAAKAFQGLTA